MTSKDNDHQTWVKSIVGLYVLILLEQEPMHGNKIAEEIRNRTKTAISPNPNALYPLLRVMEERGYIAGNWSNPETRNKRVYSITEQGLAYIPALREKVRIRLDESERKLQILREDLLHN
ncbi:PadR family transcriptional regulator [Sporomusa sp.]|uniref:PadR family transcriptional regulator n=1 Tax=Sporomusa sp. TaxID=2078658 RepID=UPI002CF4661C|nr:PadR family transcriptional regulator [Sporomusa sp.]HWR42660.1 PadR family transcriptional regulator [Sporomusa sp.]